MLPGFLSTGLSALSSVNSTSTSVRQPPGPFGPFTLGNNSTGNATTATAAVFVTTKTRWHPGSTVTVTGKAASLSSIPIIATSLPSSESTPAGSMAHSTSLPSPSTVTTDSAFTTSFSSLTGGSPSTFGPVLSTPLSTSSDVSTTTSIPSQAVSSSVTSSVHSIPGETTTEFSTTISVSSQAVSSSVVSSVHSVPGSTTTISSKGLLGQHKPSSTTASSPKGSKGPHKPSTTTTTRSSASTKPARPSANVQRSHEFHGPESCGLRDKQIALADQASMAAARGMNAVLTTYNGSADYMQSHPVYRDLMETALSTIQREALEKHLSQTNDCEGQQFRSDQAAVFQYSFYRGATWARHTIVDEDLHTASEEEVKALNWLINRSNPEIVDDRTLIDREQTKKNYDQLSLEGVDLPDLPSTDPLSPVQPPVNPQPVPPSSPVQPPVNPQPGIPSSPLQPTINPQPTPPSNMPGSSMPGNVAQQPPWLKPWPKYYRPRLPGNLGQTVWRPFNSFLAFVGNIFGTPSLFTKGTSGVAAFSLAEGVGGGTVWQGKIKEKNLGRAGPKGQEYDIRDYPQARTRNPKEFRKLMQDENFMTEHRRLMETKGWKHLQRVMRGTPWGQPPEMVPVNQNTLLEHLETIDGPTRMQAQREYWGDKIPEQLPKGEEEGWLKEDIRAMKELTADLEGVLTGIFNRPPEAFRINFDNLKGQGQVIRESLRLADQRKPPPWDGEGPDVNHKKLNAQGLLRYNIIDPNPLSNSDATNLLTGKNGQPIYRYLSQRDVQNIGRWGNQWVKPAPNPLADPAVSQWYRDIRALKTGTNELVLDHFGNPVFGKVAPDGTTSLLGYARLDPKDLLHQLDWEGGRADEDSLYESLWAKQNPAQPPRGNAKNSPAQTAQPRRNGQSSLLQLIDYKGEPWGGIIHFNAQTGSWSVLKDMAMIRENGKDDTCELALARNITMPGCAPPPPPSPPRKICEVHVKEAIVMKKECTATQTLARSTVCHDPVPTHQHDWTCSSVPEAIHNPRAPEQSKMVKIMHCIKKFPNPTTVTDQYCKPPNCPTPTPWYTTPLPTEVSEEVIPHEEDIPDWIFQQPGLCYVGPDWVSTPANRIKRGVTTPAPLTTTPAVTAKLMS